MTDYQVPDFPQDPLLIKMHAAAGELIGIVARRLMASDLTEAARIVALLQDAAGAKTVPKRCRHGSEGEAILTCPGCIEDSEGERVGKLQFQDNHLLGWECPDHGPWPESKLVCHVIMDDGLMCGVRRPRTCVHGFELPCAECGEDFLAAEAASREVGER